MLVSAIVVMGIAPGIFWLWFIYKKDKLNPEPKKYIVRAFLLGFLSAVIASFFELAFNSVSKTIQITVIAPLIEEGVKLVFFLLFIYGRKEFDEPLDGLVYASSIALGFASFENIFYILNALSSHSLGSVFLLRAFLSVPGHFLFSSVWGYYFSRVKFNLTEGKLAAGFKGYFIAVLFHSIFNLSTLISGIAFTFGFVLLMGILTVLMWKKFNDHVKEFLSRSTVKDQDFSKDPETGKKKEADDYREK